MQRNRVSSTERELAGLCDFLDRYGEEDVAKESGHLAEVGEGDLAEKLGVRYVEPNDLPLIMRVSRE